MIALNTAEPAPSLYTLRFMGLNVLLPMLLGAMIYTLFRSEQLAVFDWYASYALTEVVQSLRLAAAPLAAVLSGWFVFSLPDLLWVYASSSYFLAVWHLERKPGAQLWIVSPLLLALGAECLQAIHWVEGTFDPLDLVFYGLGYLLAECNLFFQK